MEMNLNEEPTFCRACTIQDWEAMLGSFSQPIFIHHVPSPSRKNGSSHHPAVPNESQHIVPRLAGSKDNEKLRWQSPLQSFLITTLSMWVAIAVDKTPDMHVTHRRLPNPHPEGIVG